MGQVVIENIYKDFNEVRVLKGISAKLELGGQYVIEGASGSGKSTLLYLIGGLDRPTSGKIHVDKYEVSKMSDAGLAKYRNRNVGFVFQFHFLLPSMKCLDNILLPARIAGVDEKEVEAWIRDLSKKLGVPHCLDKFPYQLSGGEQQRVNIIRALSLKPKLLLCDEPTGNLDSKNTQIVVDLLHELSQEFNSTLIVVTHDLKVSQSFQNKFVIEDGHFIG